MYKNHQIDLLRKISDKLMMLYTDGIITREAYLRYWRKIEKTMKQEERP